MKDFIFIIGASGVGKTTLAKGLFKYYNGAYVETNMVPEFGIAAGIDCGVFEEKVCWECCIVQLKKFHELGIRNIVSTDFDDLRTADIPIVFKGYNYITLKLICSDYTQNYNQMKYRGEGLIDYDLLEKSFNKINKRQLLINETEIDVTGKSAYEILSEAIDIIDETQALTEYDYEKPPKDLFYSWVSSNGLR